MTKVQERPSGVETSDKSGPWVRLTLRRTDGSIYLDRWGVSSDRIGALYLHRMDSPDPGADLHDHPWSFLSLILWGGYQERRAATRDAPVYAGLADSYPNSCMRGVLEERKVFSVRRLRLDECHTICALRRRQCWSLVIRGPRRRSWGFYTANGFLDQTEYGRTLSADRRSLQEDQTK